MAAAKKEPEQQLSLEGFKGKHHKEVESAFDDYMEARLERAEATATMTDKKDALLRTMQKHKFPQYGKKVGKKKALYVASLVSEEDVVVKKQTKDREK